jgi:hypothetical protein
MSDLEELEEKMTDFERFKKFIEELQPDELIENINYLNETNNNNNQTGLNLYDIQSNPWISYKIKFEFINLKLKYINTRKLSENEIKTYNLMQEWLNKYLTKCSIKAIFNKIKKLVDYFN